MNDKPSNKNSPARQPKIHTDGRGRSVWSDPVKTVELELVSTRILKKILDSDDAESRKSIQRAAQSKSEGVLARNPSSGTFEIIDDDDLQAILDGNDSLPPVTRPSDVTLVPLKESDEEAAEELSLVSTQALRKILRTDDKEDKEDEPPDDPGGGFDPYNSG